MELSEGIRCQKCAGGKEAYVQEPIKCNATCCDGDTETQVNKKNVHFSNEIQKVDDRSQNRYELLHLQNPRDSAGICLCCREGDCAGESTEIGRPVLVYELHEPKFDDLTINKRDYGPKPLPNRDLPPWHPIVKDRWRPLKVPSLNKTTYQHDYTPPIILPHDKKKKSMDQCIYLTEDDNRFQPDKSKKHEKDSRYEETEPFQVWRKTTIGPGEVIEVCDKPSRQIPVTEVYQRPREPSVCHAEEEEIIPEQLHGPECEKHCYSTPLMCHVKQESQDMNHPTSVNAALAAMAIEKNHLHHGGKKVHFAPEVCHVEPMTYGDRFCEGDRLKSNDRIPFQTDKHNSYAEEFGDCKNMPDHQRMNSSTQSRTYLSNDGGRGCSTPMVRHQEDYYHLPKCDADCSQDDSQVHNLDCGDHEFDNYPTYPGKSPALHVDTDNTHSPNYNPGCQKGIEKYHPDDYGRGLKDPSRSRGTSHKVSFKEDNAHSPKCDPAYSDNNEVRHHEIGSHGHVHGPSLLGHSHTEGHAYVALPVCVDASRAVCCKEDKPVYSSRNHGHHPDNSANDCENQGSNLHGSERGMRPRYGTHSNEFTLCEDIKSDQSKWWKMGCCDQVKSKGSYEYEDVPHQLMKPYCPPYTTMTHHDFKHPIAEGQRESYMPKRDPSNDCGCTEKKERNDFPKFERGGLT